MFQATFLKWEKFTVVKSGCLLEQFNSAKLFLHFNFLELTFMSFDFINGHIFLYSLKAQAMRK